jgi:hypothetical protein
MTRMSCFIFIFIVTKDIITALDIFTRYNTLWQQDRDEVLADFLSNEPHVSEFEAKIKSYEKLAIEISSNIEFMSVGPLAVYTGRITIEHVSH